MAASNTLWLLVTWVHVPTISVWDFQRPIGIVALFLNHMLRNLGRALLSVFSSVSVEIAQWRHVFWGYRWFFMPKIVFFQESVLRNTLLSVNVNQCEGVFVISWFSVFYRPSSVLR
jgi:hypothetical protein